MASAWCVNADRLTDAPAKTLVPDYLTETLKEFCDVAEDLTNILRVASAGKTDNGTVSPSSLPAMMGGKQ